jgi:hypothetical protein
MTKMITQQKRWRHYNMDDLLKMTHEKLPLNQASVEKALRKINPTQRASQTVAFKSAKKQKQDYENLWRNTTKKSPPKEKVAKQVWVGLSLSFVVVQVLSAALMPPICLGQGGELLVSRHSYTFFVMADPLTPTTSKTMIYYPPPTPEALQRLKWKITSS